VTLSISATATAIDGAGKILGSAGGRTRHSDRQSAQAVGALYNSSGQMEFDTADLVRLENAATLADVMLHEIAHVIGFGDAEIWNFWGVYEQGSFDKGVELFKLPRRLGAKTGNAIQKFQRSIGLPASGKATPELLMLPKAK
jgi:hypothetical protein